MAVMFQAVIPMEWDVVALLACLLVCFATYIMLPV